MTPDRRIPGDWFDQPVPGNVEIHDEAYVETAFSFLLYRSQLAAGVRIGRGASVYLGTMFDVGRQGRVSCGAFTLVNGARIVCDAEILIEDYVLISWNVVLMDTYRVPADPALRRRAVVDAVSEEPRRIDGHVEARPIHIKRAAWIGFDACVLPGVTIGEGAIVGARSVVTEDVEPFTIVVGNPARMVRRIDPGEITP